MPGFGKEEKKVEYLELIYDLVFVYMVGRNNSLLSHFDMPFVLKMLALTAAFAVLMIVFRTNMWINIFVTVAYVWSIDGVLYRAKNIFEKDSAVIATEEEI